MLTTARLLLRPPRPSDAASFFAFLGDPAAMRFTHCHASVRECRRRLAVFEWQRRRTGFAPWAVLTRGDGQLVGWGGLYEDPFDPGWGWSWDTSSILPHGAKVTERSWHTPVWPGLTMR